MQFVLLLVIILVIVPKSLTVSVPNVVAVTRGGAIRVPAPQTTDGQKHTLATKQNYKNLPWSVMVRAFFSSLVDPGSEVRVAKEGEQRYKAEKWKSHRKKRNGWFSRK